MADYIITTDSGCDFSHELYKKYDIIPVMMEYEVEGTIKHDSPAPDDLKAFYDSMREGAIPKTSQLNVNKMTEFFTSLVKEHNKPILHIALSSGISGTYFNTKNAAAEVTEATGVQVEVVDSLSASLAQGMMCAFASDNRKSGMELSDNAKALRDVATNINTYYTTGTLTYLQRGGRVSKTSAVLGQMLGINPVLTLTKDGKLVVCDKVRGEKNTINTIAKKIKEEAIDPEKHTLFISHGDCYDKAVKIGEQYKAELGFVNVEISNIGAIIGAHTGPGLVAIFYYGKERTM
ncbi:MAG: DegV family protein [Clostridia bacterium]|nr:DegV family protein [Clostridia bacterium]